MDAELVALIRSRSHRIRPLPPGIRTSGSLARPPRAVLFDVYGTLLIRADRTGERDQGALRTMTRRHLLRMTPRELEDALQEAITREHARLSSRGITHPEVRIEQICRRVLPTRESGELRRMIVEYELSAHPCWPMPGSGRVIVTLRRSGVALGVVSNAQFYTPLFFAALLGGQPEQVGFSRELCFYSWLRGEAKPAPGMFERAADELRRLQIPRNEVLVVGNDPTNDVEAGAKAGFMTARVAADKRSLVKGAPVSDGRRPNAILGRLADLLTVVGNARNAAPDLQEARIGR